MSHSMAFGIQLNSQISANFETSLKLKKSLFVPFFYVVPRILVGLLFFVLADHLLCKPCKRFSLFGWKWCIPFDECRQMSTTTRPVMMATGKCLKKVKLEVNECLFSLF
jgi:hypothetical protein